MFIQVYVDGVKTFKSSKGNVYGDIFIRGVSADGSPDFEQVRLRTFNEEVLNACKLLDTKDLVGLDINIRDATVEGVQ